MLYNIPKGGRTTMDEKNEKNLVFFDGDEAEEQGNKLTGNPTVEVNAPAGAADAVSDAAQDAAQDAAAGGEAYIPNFTMPDAGEVTEIPESDVSIEPYRIPQDSGNGGFGGNGGGSGNGSNSGKGSGYVTKKFLAIALIIGMIASAFAGAAMSSLFGGSNSDSSRTSLSDTETASDADSKLSLSDATGSELTVQQIVEKNADAVVEIVVAATTQNIFGQTELAEGAGSGVIVTSDGYIATNYHVIEGATSVSVTLHNGDTYDATIIGGDDANDIAVIKIDEDNLTAATIGDSSKVQVGDLAVAIGNPLGQLGGTATSGIISALDRTLQIEDRTLTLLQTDAAINAGNSGGGLFNGSGELIGIVDAKSSGTDVEGLAFALPINSVVDIINDLVEAGENGGETVTRPVIGISISDVSENNAQYYDLDGAGVYITKVSGTNAQAAGFQELDKIIALDGKEIADANDLIAKVRQHSVGDVVTVTIERNGQQMDIKTELEASSSVASSSGSSDSSQSQDQGQGQQGQDSYGQDQQGNGQQGQNPFGQDQQQGNGGF